MQGENQRDAEESRPVRAVDLRLLDEEAAEAAARFGLHEIARLGGFENVLFRSIRPPGFVLRLTHPSRRTTKMVAAEFEFLDHLAAAGVAVATPVKSITGRLVEELELESGDRIVAACMTEAPGRLRPRAEWAESDVETYGEVVGALHHAAESFQPTYTRPTWDDPVFDVGLAATARLDPPLYGRFTELRAACRENAAGAADLLIHHDAHYFNLHLTAAGSITLFDFDDCAYGTATHDIAIAIVYWLMGRDRERPAIRQFTTPFLRGYERRAGLPAGWEHGADLMMQWREIALYWLLGNEAPEGISESEQRFMEGRRKRVLDGVPYLGQRLEDLL